MIHPTPLLVFRCANPRAPEELIKDCQILCQTAEYQRCAKREEAPFRADCLTSIHYLFKNHVELSLDWIGNMPRYLSKERRWQVLQIFPDELKPGDLLFLKHRKSSRLVTHVAMALSTEEIFHCSPKKKGASIEKIDEVFTRYVQPSDINAILSYVDPRTKKR